MGCAMRQKSVAEVKHLFCQPINLLNRRCDSGNSPARGTTPRPPVAFRWGRGRFRRRRCRRKLAHERRQCHAHGLEHAGGAAHGVGTQHEALGVLIDGHLLDAVEVAHDVAPFGIEAGRRQTLVELLAQDEREKRTYRRK